MPIKIPDSLPARAVLESENIFVMTEYRAIHQDIRPLNVLILNLMPTKIVTETQLLRKLSNTPLQIQVELLRTSSYRSRNTDSDHLESFYTTFEQVRDRRFDGMIITGAPVENMEFQQVDYWEELCEIMEWSKSHVHSTLHICWGAQAGLYYHHGIEKRSLPKKLFGVYETMVLKPSSPLFRGFDDIFYAPNSRYTEVWKADILKVVEPLAPSLKLDPQRLEDMGSDRERAGYVRARVIGHVTASLFETFAAQYERIMRREFEGPLMDMAPEDVRAYMDRAKEIFNGRILKNSHKTALEIGSYSVYKRLLDTFIPACHRRICDPGRLTYKEQQALQLMGGHAPRREDDLYVSYLRVLDFITGMTDQYASFVSTQFLGTSC